MVLTSCVSQPARLSPRPLGRAFITIVRRNHCLPQAKRVSRTSAVVSGGRLPSKITLQERSFQQGARHYAEKVVKVPQMAESISEGTLKQWQKHVGDFVEQDEEIATIETDKIDVAVNAPEAGTIKELLADEEDTVTVGQDLLRMELGGEASSSHQGDDTGLKSENDQPVQSNQLHQEKPESQNPGSGTAADSRPHAPNNSKPAPPATHNSDHPSDKTVNKSRSGPDNKDRSVGPVSELNSTTQSAPGSGPFQVGRDERRVKMNRMRLRIAERLKQSQNTAASLTTFNEVDMSSVMNLRKLYKDDVLKRTGVKLGFMSAFTRASILAMKDIPAVNASIEGPNGGDTIVYRDYVDVSIAVATERGLVTPIIRNAEALDMIGIEKSISNLGRKARDNQLTIEDMAGGTFTISNGGVFGSLMGTPIINLPQTAVMGLHAIKDKPVVVDGKIEIRPMMFLALTYDHRLLDGREAVTFLVKVKEFIEDPRRMLLV